LTGAAAGTNAPAMAEEEDVAGLSFEAALKRLEEIVRKLESGEAPLDEAIALYGEGDRLKQQCEARLAAAQARIEQIQFGRDGSPAGTAPFGDE
jgi:exodeoxyribonuclease VII small subunit